MTPQRDSNGRFVSGFVANHRDIEQMLRSPEVQKELKRRADNVARAAGPGHKVDVYQGFDRARAMIWTATGGARKAEAEDRALTRAIDAGRE